MQGRNCSCHLLLKPEMRRTERTADTLKEEIAQIVSYELEDPRLTMVTVTDVRLSADKRAARVYVTVAGDEEEHKAALAALKHAAPYVRKQLGLSLNLPRTPEIHFVRDRAEEAGERVDQLLNEIEREWESQGKEEG
jgi:ribosome-binding factor A